MITFDDNPAQLVRARYIGKGKALRGKTALVSRCPNKDMLLAQFDGDGRDENNAPTGVMVYGWHPFFRRQFERR